VKHRISFFGTFLLIIALGFVVQGIRGLQDFDENREQRAVTISDVASAMSGTRWVRLNGGRLEIADSIWSSGRGGITDIYVPLVDPSDPRIVRVLVATRDDATHALVTEIADRERMKQDVDGFVRANRARLSVQRDIEGVVRRGVDRDTATEQGIRQHAPFGLAPEFWVIDEGKRPSRLPSIAAIVGERSRCLRRSTSFAVARRSPTNPGRATTSSSPAKSPRTPTKCRIRDLRR